MRAFGLNTPMVKAWNMWQGGDINKEAFTCFVQRTIMRGISDFT